MAIHAPFKKRLKDRPGKEQQKNLLKNHQVVLAGLEKTHPVLENVEPEPDPGPEEEIDANRSGEKVPILEGGNQESEGGGEEEGSPDRDEEEAGVFKL